MVCCLCSLAKTQKHKNFSIDTFLNWLSDTTSYIKFKPIDIKNVYDIPNSHYPINRIFKCNRKITFYNQSIRGITGYYSDSCNCFYGFYIYFDDKSSYIIIDSLYKDLGKSDDSGGIVLNGVKLSNARVINWLSIRKNKSIKYISKENNPYVASVYPGYKFKYFNNCNYIEIFNWQIMSMNFYNNYFANKFDIIQMKKEKQTKDFWSKALKKINKRKYKRLLSVGKVR